MRSFLHPATGGRCAAPVGRPAHLPVIHSHSLSQASAYSASKRASSSIHSVSYSISSIADILQPFRINQKPIISAHGSTGYRPVLIVYDTNTISAVKEQFALQLESHGLIDDRGVYKAVGHIRKDSATGIKISSYWDGFDGSKKTSNILQYWEAVDKVCEALIIGRMDCAEPIIRNLLCRIFHYLRITNANTGCEHTVRTLKIALDENHFDEYRKNLVAMTELAEYSNIAVSNAIIKLIENLLTGTSLAGQNILSKLPSYYIEKTKGEHIREKEKNVYIEPIRGRRIQFDTIHGVKGETHDATLYLETETKKSSDIVRILPYLGVGQIGSSSLFDYSRKLVYVGMSRPRKLLCLAIQESTYDKSKNAFRNWDIIDIRKKS